MVLAGRAIKIRDEIPKYQRAINTKNSNQFSALQKPISSGYWASEIQEMANEESTKHSKVGRAIKTEMKFLEISEEQSRPRMAIGFQHCQNKFGLLAVDIGLRYSHSEIQEIARRNSQTVVRGKEATQTTVINATFCTACIHSDLENKDLFIPDLKLDINKKVQYSKYIIRVLLPSFRKFVVEQNIEREEEARIQGLSVAGLWLPKANLSHEYQLKKCGNCKSSVFDIHRTCPNCSYKLCVSCCQEIRNGFVSDCKLTNNGNIICPPQGMGGCGPRILELKSTYPVNWISELLTKAESVADAQEPSEGACSFSGYNHGSESDNFHCPIVEGVETADQKHFQWHLYKGEPVIIPNVLNRTTGLSWEPLVMWRASRKIKSTHDLRILEFCVTNCLNWCDRGKEATQIIVISVTETTKKLVHNAPSSSRRVTRFPCFWVIFVEIQ